MSYEASDELRAELTKRGVEHETDAHGAPVWRVGDSRAYLQEMGVGLGCALTLYPVTPAQAIAATLGAGTCHEVEDEDTGFIVCSECGAVHDTDYTNYYCWCCGRKVVDE